jgi:hypothetical protein
MMMQVIWDLSCQDLNGARMPFAMSCNLKLSFHKAKGTEDRRGGEGGDHRSTGVGRDRMVDFGINSCGFGNVPMYLYNF